jgi:primosomal protein N' (replication factor Y)
LGTERVEEEVRRLFPAARPLRMDSDTTTRKGSHHLMLKRFRERDANILIGTQMIAKGLDFPGVTLVGVIAADIALNLPDFRASERCFQLMAQVSGRAGRGDDPGEVIVQTFNPEHYSLKAASAHDYLGFYQQEISFRRELLYPPFSTLANILSADIIPSAAEGRAKAAAKALKEATSAEGLAVQLLGPAPAPIERIKSRYRWHLLVKAPNHSTLSKVLQAIDRLPESIRTELTVDVDPMNLL